MDQLEGFSECALKVLERAQSESHRMAQLYVGTESLLLGLLATNISWANIYLMEVGVTFMTAEKEFGRIIGRGLNPGPGLRPYTPRASKVIEQLSKIEAIQLGAKEIGPEHLLLAILQEEASTAVKALKNLGVNCNELRDGLLKSLTGGSKSEAEKPTANKLPFEKFGNQAVRIVMRAQEFCQVERLRNIDANALLYALLLQENSKATQIFLKSIKSDVQIDFQFRQKQSDLLPSNHGISFSEKSTKIFEYASRVAVLSKHKNVSPEHLLFALVCWSQLVRKIIAESNGDIEAIENDLSAELGVSRLQFPQINQEAEKEKLRKNRALTDWFHPDSVQLIKSATALAQNRNSALITPFDLHAAFKNQITDISPGVFELTRPIAVLHNAVERGLAPEFSDEVLTIFVEAQRITTASTELKPKQLFLGFLSLARDGKITGLPSMPYEAWKSLSDKVLDSDHPERKLEVNLPLTVDDSTVRMTERLKRTLTCAKHLMKESGVSRIGTNHLVHALLIEAWNSEVGFVVNRERSLSEAKIAIANLKSDRRISRELIKDIMERAISNARRLGSSRLDINHLALSLLDEEHAAVSILLNAFDEREADKCRRVLKLRLDQCMILQSGHKHQIEPGELLDLLDIDGSIDS